MMWQELSDGPLADPSQDLLGCAPHAETLAAFLVDRASLPFTLGIYGAWGQGKTTFANMLVHYLRKADAWSETEVVEFSAWPYLTADTIWRALLDRIARVVFRIDSGDPEGRDERVETVRHRIRSVLVSEVCSLQRRVEGDDQQRYQRLVARFDRSARLANRTHRDSTGTRELSALANLVVDAASTVSPGVGSLRRLLGPVLRGGEAPATDAAADEAVRSVEEIRKDLSELFEHNRELRLIVLIDDLDRCLPEVALDLLETIKIFFFESTGARAQCLFIVAADEALIARGLRARLGQHEDVDPDVEARQYLEKIVQLRIPVPDVDARRAHRLVAAHFPEWALTTDLIGAGLGKNPRRVKQQCNVMSYRFRAQEEAERRDRK